MIEVATIWFLLKAPIAAPIRMEVRIPEAKIIKNFNAVKPIYPPARHCRNRFCVNRTLVLKII